MTSLIAQRGDEILKRLPKCHAVQGAEVGVYDGRLSAYLLREVSTLSLLLVDRWAEYPEDHPYRTSTQDGQHTAEEWEGVFKKARSSIAFAAPRAVMLRGDSTQVAQLIPDVSLDFAFIDADHRYDGVMADLKAWWPKIREGAFICGHDWDHPETHLGHTERQWGVKEAVREFFAGQTIELGQNRTWIVWKESP